jgi:hypothetical protein
MRFRIEISLREPEQVWVADIFNGAPTAFATVSGPDVFTVMKHVSHYVLVAASSIDDVIAHVNEKLDETIDMFHELLDYDGLDALVRDVGAHGTYNEPLNAPVKCQDPECRREDHHWPQPDCPASA